MIFNDLLTSHIGKTSDYPNAKWYWVRVTPEDLEHKIHRHIFSGESKWDFGKITPHTCLKDVSQFLYDNNFDFDLIKNKMQNDHTFDYSVLQKGIKQIQKYYEKLKAKQFVDDHNLPWCYIAHEKDGPYMITDGTHRQIARYIYHFIDPCDEIFPSQLACCGIDSIQYGDFGRIPNQPCLD